MMRDGRFVPNANLDVVDERCAPLDYIMGASRALEINYLTSNNFAFGGINTSLIFRRVRYRAMASADPFLSRLKSL
jgi:3-oxoacyl-[acyl-carrier-protein] synthase II